MEVARRVPRDADVMWFPWNGTFLRTDVPSVATVHDAAPFAFPAADPRKRAIEQNPFLATANTARRILVQSRFTADEVEQRLGVDAGAHRRHAARGRRGVRDRRRRPASCPRELRGRRYVLHVGAHDERKNTATLIDAFARAFPARRRRARVHAPAAVAARGRRRDRRARRRCARGTVPRRGARRAAVDVRRLRLPAARGDGVRRAGARRARGRAAGGGRRRGGVGRRRARRGRVGGRAARAARRRRRARRARGARAGARGDVLVGALHRADAGGARARSPAR